ncbi:MAG: class I SAM-dependent methyltransferase [Actinomycetota bacterium]
MSKPITKHFYDALYASTNAEGSLGWFHRLTHRVMEKDIAETVATRVLELGVNRGEHISFVTQRCSHYVATDFRLTALNESRHQAALTQAVCSAERLPFPDESFDRVIVTCLLHHLERPLDAIRETRRVLKQGGTFSLLLPCDPGIVYRLAWRLTSQRRLKKLGVVDPKLYHSLEHTGNFVSLYSMVMHVFAEDHTNERWWPLPVRSWNLNLFSVLTVFRST